MKNYITTKWQDADLRNGIVQGIALGIGSWIGALLMYAGWELIGGN